MSERETVARIRLPEGRTIYRGSYDVHRMLRAIEDAGFEVALRTAGGSDDCKNPCFTVEEEKL